LASVRRDAEGELFIILNLKEYLMENSTILKHFIFLIEL